MLKANEWYFVPMLDEVKKPNQLGHLYKVLKLKDNPNYVDVEWWTIYNDRRFTCRGIDEGMDSVFITKFGKKVNAPPKTFEILYSESVKKESTTEYNVDNQVERSDDE